MADSFISILVTTDTTLSQFMEDNNILNGKKDIVSFSDDQLLAYEDNKSSILLAYLPNDGNTAKKSVIRTGTNLKVPVFAITADTIAIASNVVVPLRNLEAFIDDRIKEIISDPSYKPLNFDANSVSKSFRVNNSCSVWIWCRALGENGQGKIFNLTPFIEDITTNVGDNGGNFSMKLVPITCIWKDTLGGTSEWCLNEDNITEYVYRGSNNFASRDSLHKNKKANDINFSQKERQTYMFHNIISPNDVVFIRFETMEMEANERKKEAQKSILESLTIDPSQLPNKVFDMIGLVDVNPISTMFAASDVSINITGRDLMKLVIEDGCYFFPTDFGGLSTPPSTKGDVIKRLVTGELSFFNAYVDRTIENSLKFIFNLLSNIEIAPSTLFSFFSGKTVRSEFTDSSNTSAGTIPVDGIWQIIKIAIDPNIGLRRIVDSSISTDSGSLLNFINKVCLKPFVEFYGDTYSDKYFFIVRKPPFDLFSIKSVIENKFVIDVEEYNVYSDNLQFNDSEIYTWYRIIPQGNFLGDSVDIALVKFPIRFFDEYAKIWGSRPYEVVSNYVDYKGVTQVNTSLQEDYLLKQATQDLAYMIETNAYLPFTRRGTITIKGDRRIKRGIHIRYKGTGEIFHVDNVTQSFVMNATGNDRVTTITVSRGMVERVIDQYFKIINLDKNAEGKAGDLNNFKVDTKVFNYFIKRQQFK